jgi:hypothetical protein
VAAAAARLLQIKQEPDSSAVYNEGGGKFRAKSNSFSSCTSNSSTYELKLRDSYEVKLSPHALDSGYMGSPYSVGSPGGGGGGGTLGGHTPSPSLDNLDQASSLI